MKNVVILDIECTCWEDDPYAPAMETIEIGALALVGGEVVGEYQTFIRPEIAPELSDFCKSLTTITQADVDAAATYPTAYPKLLGWRNKVAPGATMASWGRFDFNQLSKESKRLRVPLGFTEHINIKQTYQKTPEFKQHRRAGMVTALKRLGIELEGTHHRALDDARNITKVYLALAKRGYVD